MRVVVECRNLLDLRQQALIDLLHVSAWKRPRLTRAERTYKDKNRTANSYSHGSPRTQL
jgi:hypothetical protein